MYCPYHAIEVLKPERVDRPVSEPPYWPHWKCPFLPLALFSGCYLGSRFCSTTLTFLLLYLHVLLFGDKRLPPVILFSAGTFLSYTRSITRRACSMTSIMKSKQGWTNVICEARDEDNRIHVLQSGTVLFCCLKVSGVLLLNVRLSVGSQDCTPDPAHPVRVSKKNTVICLRALK